MGFLIGGAYGVSAGLVVYAVERGYVPQDFKATAVLGWAAAGLILAVMGVFVGRKRT